jgi:hypothetical protein
MELKESEMAKAGLSRSNWGAIPDSPSETRKLHRLKTEEG